MSLLSLYKMKMKVTSAFNGAFDSETNFNDLHERVIAKLKTLAFQGAPIISQNDPGLISSPTILEKADSMKLPCQTTSSTFAVSYANSFKEAQADLNCELISEVLVFCDFLPRPFSGICKAVLGFKKVTCKVLTNRERNVMLW
jgi:hypothetical protein